MNNTVATIAKGYAIANGFVGLLAGMFLMNGDGFAVGLLIILAAMLSSFFIYCIGEGIQLLQDIKDGVKEIKGSSLNAAKPAEEICAVVGADSDAAEDQAEQTEEECEDAEEKQRMKLQAEEQLRKERRAAGVCQWCGGKFKGFLMVECSECGTPRDYQ